jgi:hypothetical protein
MHVAPEARGIGWSWIARPIALRVVVIESRVALVAGNTELNFYTAEDLREFARTALDAADELDRVASAADVEPAWLKHLRAVERSGATADGWRRAMDQHVPDEHRADAYRLRTFWRRTSG